MEASTYSKLSKGGNRPSISGRIISLYGSANSKGNIAQHKIPHWE